MKLASELLLHQLLTQFVPGLDHARETFGSRLFDARLHPMGAYGVHDQRHSWSASAWCVEPPQRIQKADPLHSDMLKCS